MYHIETKRLKKDWFCFGTIKGYDHSFKGRTLESAQSQMKDLLKRKGIKDEKCIWEEVKEYDAAPKLEYLGGITRVPKLDYLR